MHTADLGAPLLALARGGIEEALGLTDFPIANGPDELNEIGASFVTLRKHGELRGCIGTLQAWRSLAGDVRTNAIAAAFNDPRFAPVSVQEWPEIRIEVSVLSDPSPVIAANETELIRILRPGLDGVIVEDEHHRATFLPQVWEQLPDPQMFLAQLRQKAGLPATGWFPLWRWSRYQVKKWQEIN